MIQRWNCTHVWILILTYTLYTCQHWLDHDKLIPIYVSLFDLSDHILCVQLNNDEIKLNLDACLNPTMISWDWNLICSYDCTVSKKLTGRHKLSQSCASWRIFIRKLTNFVTFFSWLFGPKFLKPLKYFGGFMTNHVNLFNLVFSKKWQNLLLFWKSMVELVLAKKLFYGWCGNWTGDTWVLWILNLT